MGQTGRVVHAPIKSEICTEMFEVKTTSKLRKPLEKEHIAQLVEPETLRILGLSPTSGAAAFRLCVW